VRSFDSSDLGLLLCNTFLEDGVVFCLLLLLVIEPATVESPKVTATLQAHGGDESLDFGCLGVGLGTFLLGARDLPSDNIFPHVIVLAQVEELPYLGCPLGTQSLGQDVIRQPRDLIITLLDNHNGEDGNIGADDTATDGFALALTVTTGTVTRVSIGKEEANTVGEEDTLFHGETLLVVTTSDAEEVAFEFIAYSIGLDFLCNFLVVEDTVSSLLIDVDGLLLARGGVSDVQLHTGELRETLSPTEATRWIVVS